MIYGIAIVSGSMFCGFMAGESLGALVGVGSNVGGVGFAMIILILLTRWISQKGRLTENIDDGIKFCQAMYLPVVVAMTASQDVLQAVKSGPFPIFTGIMVCAVGFLLVRIAARFSDEPLPEDTESGR